MIVGHEKTNVATAAHGGVALWYDEGMKLLLATLIVITAPFWIPLAILFAAISTVYGHIDGIHSTYRKMRE